MSDIFAVDVGGTFTDLIVLDPETGEARMAKAPTTPEQPTDGVLDAVQRAELPLHDARAFLHGTTLGINTVLEHNGAKTGLITTKGFRDVLEIGRCSWPMYQLHWERPAPLVPRYLRREVGERVSVTGEVLEPLDEADVRRAIEELQEEEVESIAICLLHGYAHPQHEQRIGELLESEYPGVAYSLSHELTREYREYERTATTVMDAYIKPRMGRYLASLDDRMTQGGFGGELFVTRSDGGVMTVTEAQRRSVATLISGPASGVAGSAFLGQWLESEHLIAADMGGTSFDAALIVNHAPILSPMTRVEEQPLLMPVIELATIGAGGGSIAWIDSGGALNVGPQSAGADPGPICYGKGGTEPTFTDAALVSGLLDPGFFLGGEIPLDVDAARSGIESVAEPLGLEVENAASGIIALTEAKMASTLEQITIGKGFDPRDFALLAYGGGGPLVGAALAAQLEVPTVVVPNSPAAFSAWGMLTLDLVHDFSQTNVRKLELIETDDVLSAFADLEARGERALEQDGVPAAERRMLRSIDMRYEGQEHTLTVRLEPEFFESVDLDTLRGRFDQEHETAYTYSLTDPVEIVGYRVRAIGSLAKPPRRSAEKASTTDPEAALVGTRRATHHESGGEQEWSIYARDRLGAGAHIEGPAIVEEATATTLVPADRDLTVDELGNLVLRNVESTSADRSREVELEASR